MTGSAAAPVKNEGAAISYDSAQESFTARYNHETIAMGFSITEEAMEDNLYDSLSARYTKALARAMAYTKQVKAAYPLNNGFTNSYQSGDGVNLFTASGDGVTGVQTCALPILLWYNVQTMSRTNYLPWLPR